MSRTPRRIATAFAPTDGVLFLALWWGGGRSGTLKDVIHLHDFVNRSIPTADELDGGLNRLIAAGLIAERDGRFRVPAKVMRAYEAFRRKRRRDRFTMAGEFVRVAGPLDAVPRRVRVTAADQARAYEEYRDWFEGEWNKLTIGHARSRGRV
ncbi:MAG TPA: hypothetical protein VD866_33045 [Urbifossiella sp.]|nr:hypothetical protein [Urbifossiella sp.]